jgi:hypothetical protein
MFTQSDQDAFEKIVEIDPLSVEDALDRPFGLSDVPLRLQGVGRDPF